MKIINPNCELWIQGDSELEMMEHVCKCAQISYQSEPKTGEAAEKFYNALIKSGHLSCLRHASFYYIMDEKHKKFEPTFLMSRNTILWDYENNPYIKIGYHKTTKTPYVSTNGQFLVEHPDLKEYLAPYQVTKEEFAKVVPQFTRFTFCLTTQISTTRELLRHSPQNVTEMSTRYIKFGGKVEPTIVKPHWITWEDIKEWETADGYADWCPGNYLDACNQSFKFYENLIEDENDCIKAEDARGVLPLDTMSKIVMTNTLEDWMQIIGMRVHGTTGKPHPNVKEVITLVMNKLNELGY